MLSRHGVFWTVWLGMSFRLYYGKNPLRTFGRTCSKWAVRLIVDREREIEAFNIEEYWSITAQFTHPDTGESFEAKVGQG